MESKIRATRTGNKGAVTKLLKKFEELKQRSKNEDVGDREFRLLENKLVVKRDILIDLNAKLMEVLTEEDIADEIEETDEYIYDLDDKIGELQEYPKQFISSLPFDKKDHQSKSSLNKNAEYFTPRTEIAIVNASAINTEGVHNQNTLNTHTGTPSADSCTPSTQPSIQNAHTSTLSTFPLGTPSAFSQGTPSANLATTSSIQGTQSTNLATLSSHLGTQSTHLDTNNSYNVNGRLPTQYNSMNHHRLPKLDLPRFDGDVLQWRTFWDSFESTIHFNGTLTPIQKFSYLKAQLTGTAAQTVAGFMLTNANYETAVALLNDRFGKPQKIINAHMKALMDLPPPGYNLVSLRNYGDYLETYVRGLECLGQTQDMYGALLVPIIISKLPINIRMNIARDYDCDTINLKLLRKAIAKEVRVLETGHFNSNTELQYVSNTELPHTTATFFTGAKKTGKLYKSKNNNRHEKRDTKTITCVYCEDAHFSTNCTKIKDPTARSNILKRKNLCFNCLRDHRVAECNSKNRCKTCDKKHHTSICTKNEKKHDQEDIVSSVNVVETENYDTTILYAANQQTTNVLLKTAIAPVVYKRQSIDANILFDEGAQRSFITQSLTDRLQIKPQGRETISIAAFGKTSKKVRHLETAYLELKTHNGNTVPITALIVPDIAVPLQNKMRTVVPRLPYLKGLTLAHPVSADERFEISLLIGADFYWKVVGDEVIRGNGPTAVSSKIGYLLSGPVSEPDNSLTSSVHLNHVNITSSAHEETSIDRFWNLESIGIRPPEQDEEESYLKSYQQNNIKYEDGHYTAKLPWKPDFKELPTNYGVAKARTENTIKRLARDPRLLQVYSDIIQDQEKRGFIEKVRDDVEPAVTHYIPHHAVKKDSTTTPIRIVYDCSCSQSPNHTNLNECLMSVPPDLNDLTKILIRFRAKQYGISTDIEKAFLHVGLDEADRDMTRFFWLEDPSKPEGPLTTYRFKSVLFGATCSPFILNATILKHLEETNTEISSIMTRDLYVDNVLSNVNGEDEALQYFRESREIMSKAGFNLRSWSSNSDKLRQLASSEHVLESKPTVKILGLVWNTDTDKIGFQQCQLSNIKLPNVTKREILKQSSRIFDPLGVLGPVSIRAKILMQHLWKEKFDWDDILPHDIQKTWNLLANDLEEASTLELSRRYTSTTDSTNELHVFVDASETAYGASVYLCNGHESTLVMAKNRVAPLKQLTLPQLELMAALVGARLGNHVKSTLQINTVTYWSDSQIVLQWLSTKKQLKRFIRNRVTEIQKLTHHSEWRYCPTKENPADLQTRGIGADEFRENELWFKGPIWIVEKSKWPTWSQNVVLLSHTDVKQDTLENEKESVSGIHNIIDISRFSSLSKLIRVTSYVYRFIRNCRLQPQERYQATYVCVDEIHQSTEQWIKSCQNRSYKNEIDELKRKEKGRITCTLIRQLKLYIQNDIVRCGGRLHNAPLKEESRFPILLPSKHPFTKLIILDTHSRLKHTGVLSTVTTIRQQYWIPQIRQSVKNILRGCVTCRKVCSRPYHAPDPPPLQKDRLLQEHPFTVTGVDFAGPFYVKGQSGTNDRAFLCLFTCASTRAVHLEIVHDLTEASFLQAFRRFTSRKSLPQIMISDNASTYVAASHTLKNLTGSASLNSKLTNYGTTWKFIPKRAPWYGGFWERLIGITKSCLKKTLGRSYVTYEELHTIITEVEAIVNDRPLTYLSTDIEDSEPLTPSHLLYGRKIVTTPYPTTENELSINSGKPELSQRFKKQRTILDEFWNRWKHEYLTSLREHHRQTGNNSKVIQIGDLVQVHDDKLPRNKWTIAIVERLNMGNDALIRSAIIRTSYGITSRPITKLYPLEVRDSTVGTSSTIQDNEIPSTSGL